VGIEDKVRKRSVTFKVKAAPGFEEAAIDYDLEIHLCCDPSSFCKICRYMVIRDLRGRQLHLALEATSKGCRRQVDDEYKWRYSTLSKKFFR
jgi:hypothetical protein